MSLWKCDDCPKKGDIDSGFVIVQESGRGERAFFSGCTECLAARLLRLDAYECPRCKHPKHTDALCLEPVERDEFNCDCGKGHMDAGIYPCGCPDFTTASKEAANKALAKVSGELSAKDRDVLKARFGVTLPPGAAIYRPKP